MITKLLAALDEFAGSSFPTPLALSLAKLLIGIVRGDVTEESALAKLQDLLIDSGLAPTLLRSSLTQRGIRFADAAADIAEAAKLAIKEMAAKGQP